MYFVSPFKKKKKDKLAKNTYKQDVEKKFYKIR